MKRFFPAIIFLLLFNASQAIAQAPKEAEWLAPACKPKTYGLHNSKGEVAAEAKFDMLEEADGKGWIAFSGGRYGVINSSGNWIIKPNYEIIVQFLNGKAVAGKKNKQKQHSHNDEPFAYYSEYENYSDSVMYYGIVDASGVWITEPSFEFIRLCDDGTAQYADSKNKVGFINADGSVMLRAQYDYASRMSNGVAVIGEPDPNSSAQFARYNRKHFRAGKYFVIDRSGNKLNAEGYDMIREFKDGRAAFNKGGIWKSSRYSSSDLRLVGGKWGFLDASGKEIIAPAYDYVYDFVNEKAKVRSGQRIFWVDKDGKETDAPLPEKKEKAFTIFCAPGFFGYIGLDGKFVIEPQYFAAKEFSEGLAAVMPLRASDMDCNNVPEINSKEYEISHRGYSRMLNKLLNLDRDYGIDFDMESQAKMLADSIRMADSIYASMLNARRLYGYADKTGNMVLPAKYELALPFHNGRAYVLFREKWGVIDTKGNWIFAPVLEWPDELSFVNFEYANGGRQYYNYESDKSSGAFSFKEGVGCIYKYDHYGFIDSTGKIIAAPVYDEVKPFVNGLAAVRHNGYWGYIDKTGKEIIPMKYLSAGSFSPEGLACVGVAPEKKSGEETYIGYEDPFYGYIDKKGNWAIKPKFTEARDFSSGYAAVSTDYEKSGYIDKTGKFVIPPKYNYAGDFEYGFALVRVSAYEPIYIDKTGKASKTFTYDHPPKDKSIPLAPRLGVNNYYGFVNDRGEAVIPYEFSEVGSFSRVN